MAIYKDVEPLEVFAYNSESEEFDEGVKFALEKLDELPTADVVLRADLEIWKDIAHRETSYVGKAKAEVAREIFAEIKKICYPWKNPMVKMDWAKFRELEKKFTEGER